MSTFGFFGLYSKEVTSKTVTNDKAIKQDETLFSRTDVIAVDDLNDGSVIIQGGHVGANYNGINSELVTVKSMVEEYMGMAQQPEINKAVDIIINDIVTCEEDEDPVTVNLENVEVGDGIKTKITEEFKHVLHLMDFNNTSYEKVRKWYVEGRQAFQVVVDPTRKRLGIQKVIMLDSRCVRPVTVLEKEMRDGVEVIKAMERKYYFNPNNVRNTFSGQVSSNSNFQPTQQELMFDEESIVYIDSGEEPLANGIVPSLLNPAIRPLNNLVTTEDATVIYAITRAPEKRAFYLDVGTLGKKSAEEYMAMMMGKFKNKLSFDRTTGKVANGTHLMSIAEDYWLPRREGANATEISTVGGGQQLGEMDHVVYFRGKLYDALNIPSSRVSDEGGNINIGGSDLAEVTREEYRFSKFCNRCRRRYSKVFLELLRRQLILKNVVTQDDWLEKVLPHITFDFTTDNFIREQQENEILAGRMQTLGIVEPFIGSIFSIEYAQKTILRMSDEDIKEEQDRIAQEKKDGKYPEIEADEQVGDTSPLKFRPDRKPAPPGADTE